MKPTEATLLPPTSFIAQRNEVISMKIFNSATTIFAMELVTNYVFRLVLE